MFHFSRLLPAALLIVAGAFALHVISSSPAPAGPLSSWAPTPPSQTASSLAIPAAAATPQAPSDPYAGLWQRLNSDTGTYIDGEIGILQELEDVIRQQAETLLDRIGGGR